MHSAEDSQKHSSSDTKSNISRVTWVNKSKQLLMPSLKETLIKS